MIKYKAIKSENKKDKQHKWYFSFWLKVSGPFASIPLQLSYLPFNLSQTN